MINDKQYRRLLREYARTGNMSLSALNAGVDRKTARKYIQARRSPGELRKPHRWRTRADPLAEVWPEAERQLRRTPQLEATMLFEHLRELHPEKLAASALRTFQRRVAAWRLEHGPEPEVIFPQVHRPGEVLQIDWTRALELGVSINRQPLDHLFCQTVLPYSNWQWAVRCQSESFLSLRNALQEALFRLGKVPGRLQIDNSSAATHHIRRDGRRELNADLLALVAHFGMNARTIAVGCPNQNGDVESHQRHFKRRLDQQLHLRGHRDFDTEEQYDHFVQGILVDANKGRTDRLAEELAVMNDLPPSRLCEYDEMDCRVCGHSTIRVKNVAYSVPARFIGRRLRARVFERCVEIYHGPTKVLEVPRSKGGRPVIDFRHVIDSLLRKPGAFARYYYREELFPSVIYRRVFDRLVEDYGQREGELEYLRLLKLTSEVGQNAVQARLEARLTGSGRWRVAEIRVELVPRQEVLLNSLDSALDLTVYDQLLGNFEEVSDVA